METWIRSNMWGLDRYHLRELTKFKEQTNIFGLNSTPATHRTKIACERTGLRSRFTTKTIEKRIVLTVTNHDNVNFNNSKSKEKHQTRIIALSDSLTSIRKIQKMNLTSDKEPKPQFIVFWSKCYQIKKVTSISSPSRNAQMSFSYRCTIGTKSHLNNQHHKKLENLQRIATVIKYNNQKV